MTNPEFLWPNSNTRISERTAKQTIEFFSRGEGSLDNHAEAIVDMYSANPELVESVVRLVNDSDLASPEDTNFIGGFTMAYKLLQTQAQSLHVSLPKTQTATFETFFAEVTQNEESFYPYIIQRSQELEAEDPIFLDFIYTFADAKRQVQGMEEAALFVAGGVLAYEMVRRQADVDHLTKQFNG